MQKEKEDSPFDHGLLDIVVVYLERDERGKVRVERCELRARVRVAVREGDEAHARESQGRHFGVRRDRESGTLEHFERVCGGRRKKGRSRMRNDHCEEDG